MRPVAGRGGLTEERHFSSPFQRAKQGGMVHLHTCLYLSELNEWKSNFSACASSVREANAARTDEEEQGRKPASFHCRLNPSPDHGHPNQMMPSKQSNKSIAKLPRDILHEIWSFLSVADLLQLYCSGDSEFTAFFERAGVAKIALTCELRKMYGQTPVMLSGMATTLTSFHLHTKRPLAEFPHQTQQKLRLMINLRELELCTPEAEQILTTDDPDELTALASVLAAIPTDRSPSSTKNPIMINLSNIFPNLKELTVHGDESHLESRDFCVLPRTLMTLSIAENDKIDDTIFDYLPATLKKLHLGPQVSLEFPVKFPDQLESFHWGRNTKNWSPTASMLRHLPPSLRELTLVAEVVSPLSATLYSELPPQLTLLTVTPQLTLDAVVKLPSDLLELCLTIKTTAAAKLLPTVLPRHLTSLTLNTTNIGAYYPLTMFELPSTLLSLTITLHNFYVLENVLAPKMPPHLTYLSLSTGTHFSGQWPDSWPDSLTHLHITGSARLSNESAKLPSSLRTLMIQGLKVEGIVAFPSSLTTLVVRGTFDGETATLPPSLTYFTANSIRLDLISLIPPNLRTFQVELINTPQRGHPNLELNSHRWPQSLTVLQLNRYSVPCQFTRQDIENLPPGLVEFAAWKFSSSLLRFLPRAIRHLTFQRVDGYLGGSLRDLPPQLETLVIEDCLIIPPRDLVHFPRSLTRLGLSNWFSDADLALLPPKVVYEYMSPDDEDRRNPMTPPAFDPVTRQRVITVLPSPSSDSREESSSSNKCITS